MNKTAKNAKYDLQHILSSPTSKGFHLFGIEDYAKAYKEGTVTPVQVVKAIYSHLTSYDSNHPELKRDNVINSIVEANITLSLEAAEASWKRIKEGKAISILDGVPFTAKDEMDVAGFHTGVGTSFINKLATTDATGVARMKASGAVFIGKVNMHEIGIGTNGHNTHEKYGIAKNPYNVKAYTGGSSSGSAGSVASGLVPISLGADGGGSIRIPARLNDFFFFICNFFYSYCGIPGLKPTFGRVGEHGAFSLCPSVSHIGPLASNVKDVAITYQVIAGVDDKDEFTHIQPLVHLKDYNKKDLSDITIGIYHEWNNDSDPVVSKVNFFTHSFLLFFFCSDCCRKSEAL